VKVSLLDAIDRQIVHILAIEPRASFRTVADVAGISDQTAARRYRRLCESAGLRVLVGRGSELERAFAAGVSALGLPPHLP